MSTFAPDMMKAELMASNQEFRELAKEHQRYESRLRELAQLQYPNEHERQEEMMLKRKKLFVKDKMEVIIQQYKRKSFGH